MDDKTEQTQTLKVATFVKQMNANDFQGDARLYKVTPPMVATLCKNGYKDGEECLSVGRRPTSSAPTRTARS